jgi:MFS family permease
MFTSGERRTRLGLAANWRQFALLVAVNAFVGGMVGMERTVLPLLGEAEFGLRSATVVLSFVATFGAAKALANLFAGRLSERFSRKSVLVVGWLLGVPVPFILIWAPSWGWIIGANVLLGLNQGLAWSMTVNMKIDLAGPQRRGLALGLNEAAGYLAVAAAAYLTGVIAQEHGLRPEPFYLGIAFAGAGLAMSALLVRDTAVHVGLEASALERQAPTPLRRAFADATWRTRRLVGVSQAGFVNNLNDALAWGLFPLFFASRGLSIERIAVLAAAYPLIWGFLQLGTGWLSDTTGRRPLIVGGMLLQGAAVLLVAAGNGFALWLPAVSLLGIGTAMVYPVLLAAVVDAVHPEARAGYLGVYRFWRDSGAIAGALLAGAVADLLGLAEAIYAVGAITVASGLVAAATVADKKQAWPAAVRPGPAPVGGERNGNRTVCP